MFILRDVLPSPMLSEYVQRHKIIRFTFEANAEIPFKAYYPRPEHCLIVYLRDLGKISYTSDHKILTDPKCSISGLATGMINRYVSHDFWAIQTIFQPSALFRLTGIPSYELSNTFIDAEAIWGKEIRIAHEQMCNTDNIDEAIKVVESFLEKMVLKSKRDLLGIDKVSQIILSQNESISLGNLANDACLSIRQFNRKFNERIGINPKIFDRIVRFNNTFRIKNRHFEH